MATTYYTIVPDPPITDLLDGMHFTLVPHVDCGDDVFLEVKNCTGFRPVLRWQEHEKDYVQVGQDFIIKDVPQGMAYSTELDAFILEGASVNIVGVEWLLQSGSVNVGPHSSRLLFYDTEADTDPWYVDSQGCYEKSQLILHNARANASVIFRANGVTVTYAGLPTTNEITIGPGDSLTLLAVADNHYSAAAGQQGPPGPPGIGAEFIYITSDTEAESGRHYAADTRLGGFLILLPPTPAMHDTIVIYDVGGDWKNNEVTVQHNGNPIDGLLEDLYLDLDYGEVLLVWTGDDWQINPDSLGAGYTSPDPGDNPHGRRGEPHVDWQELIPLAGAGNPWNLVPDPVTEDGRYLGTTGWATVDWSQLGGVPSVFPPTDHVHNGTDMPKVNHNDLEGIGPDQHHSQAHLLYGPDHSDVNDTAAMITRQVLAWDGVEFGPANRDNFIAAGYVSGTTYYKGDIVVSPPYMMWCNNPDGTQEYAFPTPVGDPTYTLPEVPAWTTYSDTAVIYSGHLYAINVPGYIRALRVWVPELTGSTSYRFVIIRNPNGTNPIYKTIEEPVLNENNWTILTIGTELYTAGEELLVYIDALNSGSTISPGGTPADWIRDLDSNNVPPVSGSWNVNNNQTLLRIHETTADSALIDMTGVTVGTRFQFVDVNDANKSVTFLAQSNETYAANVYSWTVAVESIGTNGYPTVGGRCLTTITVPQAADTKFVGIPDYFLGNQPTWANITSYLQLDGVSQPVNPDNAYGVDIAFQELLVPTDWDLMAFMGGGGGGGGGSFTPDLFAGPGTTGYVPDPVTASNYFLRDDGTWQSVASPPVGGLTLAYKFNSATLIADPGSGYVACNNADPLLVTMLSCNKTTVNGTTLDITWNSLQRGDYIFYLDEANGITYAFQVDDPITDHGAWMQFPVQATDASGVPPILNDADIKTMLLRNPENTIPVGGDQYHVLTKNSSADYDMDWAAVDWANIVGKPTIIPEPVGVGIFGRTAAGAWESVVPLTNNKDILINSADWYLGTTGQTNNPQVRFYNPTDELIVYPNVRQTGDFVLGGQFMAGSSHGTGVVIWSVYDPAYDGTEGGVLRMSGYGFVNELELGFPGKPFITSRYPLIFNCNSNANGTGIFEVQMNDVPALHVAVGGNVGVGTDTPAYPLDVTGDANITGQYLINGTPHNHDGVYSPVGHTHEWADITDPPDFSGYDFSENPATYVGEVDTFRCVQAVTEGQVVQMGTSGAQPQKIMVRPANQNDYDPVVGIALATAAQYETVEVLVRGTYYNGGTDHGTEVPLYVGATIGEMTATVPGSGKFAKIVGFHGDNGYCFINPQWNWTQVT